MEVVAVICIVVCFGIQVTVELPALFSLKQSLATLKLVLETVSLANGQAFQATRSITPQLLLRVLIFLMSPLISLLVPVRLPVVEA